MEEEIQGQKRTINPPDRLYHSTQPERSEMSNNQELVVHTPPLKGVLKGLKKISLILLSVYLILYAVHRFLPEAEYRHLPLVGSRIAIWVVAQLHLMFGAFVLGVPIFAVIAEIIGAKGKNERYDRLAKEFTQLLFLAFTTTAVFGSILLVALFALYPRFFTFMQKIFAPSWLVYVLLIFGEVIFAYLYWYTWDLLKEKKGLHILLGILLNIFGTAILCVANAWVTFMMTPGGVSPSGALTDTWKAIANFAWMPINIHRFIANVAFGGSVVAAYAAYRFLTATSQEERAHYDWMGYTGNFIAVCALIPLPFAGYWLGTEIYAFSEQMGISMMGGVFSWLWIMQAVLIGSLFLAANYYLWMGMDRIRGAERFKAYILPLLVILGVCFIVWATPHSMVASLEEARRMGGAHHPLLGLLGVMSAKNTVVNLMILATFLSFMLYRRGNKIETVSWAPLGKGAQWLFLGACSLWVIFWGVYGYRDFFGWYGPAGDVTPANIRVGFSVYQVLAVLLTMAVVTVLDLLLYRNARLTAEVEWGKMPPRSQYVLLFLAISFTWLMGLMGYIRSGVRQYWHIYGVMKDTSPDAYIPTIGFATTVISLTVLAFFGFIALVFRMAMASKQGSTKGGGALP